MKKLLYLAPAALLALASCSQEDKPALPAENSYNLQVTVQLPGEFGTRANPFSAGIEADVLNYAVYDGTTGNLVEYGVAEDGFNSSLKAQMDFNLAKGKFYNIAFFAQSDLTVNSADAGVASNGVYDFNASAKTVTVNYANMISKNNLADAYDCFYGLLTTEVLTDEPVSASVILYRPVAQINWGANDLGEDVGSSHPDAFGTNGQYIQTTLSTKAYSVLNLITGDVQGDVANITLGAWDNFVDYTFPEIYGEDGEVLYKAGSFTWIGMQYVLSPKDGYTADLNLTISNTATGGYADLSIALDVAQAPLQANYQTNIYGALLSNNLDVSITKSPGYKNQNNIPYPAEEEEED